MKLISNFKAVPVVTASVRAARSQMIKHTGNVLQNNSAECSVFCDIAELGLKLLASLQHTPEGRAAFKAENGEKMVLQWTKTWIDGEETLGRTNIVDGCPKSEFVQKAAEQCIAMSKRKSKSSRNKASKSRK